MNLTARGLNLRLLEEELRQLTEEINHNIGKIVVMMMPPKPAGADLWTSIAIVLFCYIAGA